MPGRSIRHRLGLVHQGWKCRRRMSWGRWLRSRYVWYVYKSRHFCPECQVTSGQSIPCFHVFFRIHFLSCGIKLRLYRVFMFFSAYTFWDTFNELRHFLCYGVKLRLNRKKPVFSIFLPHTLFKIRLTSYGTTVTNNRISVFAYTLLCIAEEESM